MGDAVNNPDHYGGKDNPYEAIKVIDAWGLNFSLGCVVKYVCRAGKKEQADEIEDLEKAAWYLANEIKRRKGEKPKESSTEKKVVCTPTEWEDVWRGPARNPVEAANTYFLASGLPHRVRESILSIAPGVSFMGGGSMYRALCCDGVSGMMVLQKKVG